MFVGGGIFAQINNDIQNFAGNAADQFGLCIRRFLEMKSTEYAVAGFGFVVLDEFDLSNGFIKLRLLKGFEEISTLIAKDFGFNQKQAGEGVGRKFMEWKIIVL